MRLNVLLTLDLEGELDVECRPKFDEELKRDNWTKVPKVTTAWVKNYQDAISNDQAVRQSLKSVALAAKNSGVHTYNAVALAGTDEAVSWDQSTEHGLLNPYVQYATKKSILRS